MESGKKVIDSVLEGFNWIIFTYGQTGKTYTMVGDFSNNEKKGIIPRAFDYIFVKINQLSEEDNINYTYNINIAFIRLYLETIQDLFEPNNNVKIRKILKKEFF